MTFKEHDGSLNRNKNLTGRFCYRPFELLEIHKEYYGFVCCPSWLPVIVGNCNKSGILDTWNSEKSKKIRASIIDGSFKYCDHKECPKIQGDELPRYENLNAKWKKIYDSKQTHIEELPSEIALCYDISCNLACPSCRSEKVLDIRGRSYDEKLAFTNYLIELVNQSQGQKESTTLRVTGSGDPIAAPIYFKLLQEIDGTKLPHLKIILQTNGLLLNAKNWQRLHKIHKNIVAISISIDAASAETYRKVRRLGDWDKLMNNLSFISKLKEEFNFNGFCLNFVVQKENYNEMSSFVQMALDLKNVTEVFFSFVNDWDTWSQKDYQNQCIWKKDHPLFNDFLKTLANPIFDNEIVIMGNLSEYRKMALTQNFGNINV